MSGKSPIVREDLRGKSDGKTDAAPSLVKNASGTDLSLPDGSYLVRQAIMSQTATLSGRATLKQDTANKAIVVVQDPTDVTRLVEDFKIRDLGFGPMPAASSDDFAAIDLGGTRNGQVVQAALRDPCSGIRIGYRPLGTIAALAITNPGTGYTNATIAITGGGATRNATATATIVNGQVVSATITDAGAGYGTVAPTVTITGDGTGATADADYANGAKDALLMGDYIEGAKNFGVEVIHGDYSRLVGLAIGNKGTQVGSHGIRWSGLSRGTVAAAVSIRDRAGPGLSMQQNSSHGVLSGAYIRNTVNGVESTSSVDYRAKHFIGPVVIDQPTGLGVDLDHASHVYLQALIDQPGGIGIRTGAQASAGKHVLDALVINPRSAGLSLRSDKNLVKVLVDNNGASNPVFIGGSNNLVIVQCVDTVTSTSIWITGNNNVVLLSEAGTGSPAVRIDGTGNQLYGRVTGNMLVNGNDNTFDGHVGGSITVNAGKTGTKLAGTAIGGVTDNGTGTDVSGLRGARTRGADAITTSAAGIATITHGCFATPKSASASVETSAAAYFCTVASKTSTQVTFKVWDAAGAAVANTVLTLDWLCAV